MLKKIIIFFYILLLVCMASATFIEKLYGTDYASIHIYGSWWFCLSWALLTVFGVVYFLKRKVRRLSVVCLHLSFVFILLGALLTHLFAEQGYVYLQKGKVINHYIVQKNNRETEKKLPFSLLLNDFEIKFYDGTVAHKDYVSNIQVISGDRKENVLISMNHIYSFKSVRLYQMSYDEDGEGSYLSVNIDPFGIPVTYLGYVFLFVSLIWILIDPKGTYRRLWKSELLKKGVLFFLFIIGFGFTVSGTEVLKSEAASRFCELYCLYNNRICPLQTFAIDFTKKIYHKRSYKEYSAEQVLTGFLFYGQYWDNEPVIRIKNKEMRNQFNLPEYTSLRSFFREENYILGPSLQEYYKGHQDGFHKAVAEMDEKLQLILSLRKGTSLKLFPYTEKNVTAWYAPDSDLPDFIPETDKFLMQHLLTVFREDVLKGDETHFLALLNKVKDYQIQHGGSSLPTTKQVRAERLYNRIPFATILFMFNLTMGFLSLFYMLYRLTRKDMNIRKQDKYIVHLTFAAMAGAFFLLTLCEALRWMISGEIPMKNGYETMLLLAWFIMLITMLTYRKFSIVLTFGFLLSGFFLLVAHISQMDPQITPMMPVLASPLLSIHVSIIMMSFALLSLTFLCGVLALFIVAIGKKGDKLLESQLESLQLLSRLLLYPALSLLGIGIFIGAIWANISWGRYWSWDPKEVWALITFMFYAVAVHVQTFPSLRKPVRYHLFMTLAFLMVLMTYFGVNYFLGGMHSYAN